MAVNDINSLTSVVDQLIQNDAFFRLINDPLAGFGPAADPYLFAQWFPEKLVPENSYTEEGIRYRSVIANHATRFSPVQIKGTTLSGTMKVELGNSDIGAQFTAKDYDAFNRLRRRVYGRPGVQGGGVSLPSMQQTIGLLNWVEYALVRPLHGRNELDRINMVVSALVQMRGDDGYAEDVAYPNPPGHRVSAAGTWSSNTYDPWSDIMAMAEFLNGKGYGKIQAIIIGVDIRTILANNLIMKTRSGRLAVNTNIVSGIPGRLTTDDLNTLLEQDGLPAFTLYDKQYSTQAGTAYYYPRGTMTFLVASGRDQEIDRGDAEPLIVHDTLGYVGVGTPAGQPEPGACTYLEVHEGKNPSIEGQAWQCSLAVMQDPEGMAVISGIA